MYIIGLKESNAASDSGSANRSLAFSSISLLGELDFITIWERASKVPLSVTNVSISAIESVIGIEMPLQMKEILTV